MRTGTAGYVNLAQLVAAVDRRVLEHLELTEPFFQRQKAALAAAHATTRKTYENYQTWCTDRGVIASPFETWLAAQERIYSSRAGELISTST